MPIVTFVFNFFINSNISSVISPRGMVRVPSTSNRAMIRGFSGALAMFTNGLSKESNFDSKKWEV
jgi:hypothetical protein